MKTILLLSFLFAYSLSENVVCESCHSDKEKFCPDVQSHDEIKNCMRENWNSLSEKCKAAIEDEKHSEHHDENDEKYSEVCKACHEDKQKLCGTSKTHEEIKTCMQAHWNFLSEECKSAIETLFHHHELPHETVQQNDHSTNARLTVYQACHEDKNVYCGSFSDHLEIRKCMHEHWNDLSDKCRDTIQQIFGHMELTPEQISLMHTVHAKCHESREKLCSNFEHFNELRQCMASHWNDLPEDCRDAITKFSQQFHPETAKPVDVEGSETHKDCPLKACVVDIETLCGQESSRAGVKDCLLRNLANLKPECRSAFQKLVLQKEATQTQAQTQAQAQTQTSQTIESTSNTVSEDEVKSTHFTYTGHFEVPANWRDWVVQLWWTYPLGLVLIIQLLACIRVSQIRKEEQL